MGYSISEGGCYAKTANLSPLLEPEIFGAIKRNALLENVAINSASKVDFSNTRLTENGRVSYPIEHLEKIARPNLMGPPASHVIFLSADAYGVLPPVAKLDEEQALYYFMSGFTAKVAGTEIGVTQPSATFSACFGAPFLTLKPEVYAKILFKRLRKSGSHAYLVNTGWDGTGQRISLAKTRSVIRAIQSGEVDHAPTNTLPLFHLSYPRDLTGLAKNDLDPTASYANHSTWKENAVKLTNAFKENFSKWTELAGNQSLLLSGPHT